MDKETMDHVQENYKRLQTMTNECLIMLALAELIESSAYSGGLVPLGKSVALSALLRGRSGVESKSAGAG